MFGELGALVCEPVAFFSREVATPMAYFNVSFQQRGMDERFCELVSYAGIELCTRRGVFIGSVGKCRTLAFRLRGEVSDISRREFDFGLLLSGRIS